MKHTLPSDGEMINNEIMESCHCYFILSFCLRNALREEPSIQLFGESSQEVYSVLSLIILIVILIYGVMNHDKTVNDIESCDSWFQEKFVTYQLSHTFLYSFMPCNRTPMPRSWATVARVDRMDQNISYGRHHTLGWKENFKKRGSKRKNVRSMIMRSLWTQQIMSVRSSAGHISNNW